jgi:hypothetical protein
VHLSRPATRAASTNRLTRSMYRSVAVWCGE